MKNIHISPTGKPSRLQLFEGINEFEFELCSKDSFFNKGVHIYITNDEYIGLSYYLDGDLVRKGVVDDADYWKVRKDYKKIILTTDQDLIKDGVQPIPDEFLEWFVKNPSCEFVQTDKILQTRHGVNWYDLPNQKTGNEADGIYRFYYKIIIPKQESNQDYTALLKEVGLGQEMLDKARREYVSDINCSLYSEQIVDTIKAFSSDAFEQGYKFAQEQIVCSYCNRKIVKPLTTEDLKPKQELSVRLLNSLKQFNITLDDAVNTEPNKLKQIGFGNRSIIELQSLKPKQEIPNPINNIREKAEELRKQETLQEFAKKTLANNVDGLREVLKDDDLFFFYKGVILRYGEAMADEWQGEEHLTKEQIEEVALQLYPNQSYWIGSGDTSRLYDPNERDRLNWIKGVLWLQERKKLKD